MANQEKSIKKAKKGKKLDEVEHYDNIEIKDLEKRKKLLFLLTWHNSDEAKVLEVSVPSEAVTFACWVMQFDALQQNGGRDAKWRR